MSTTTTTTTTLQSDTVLDVIVSFCPSLELFKTVQLVCSKWHKASSLQEIWKYRYHVDFASKPSLLEKACADPAMEQKTWKIWYQERMIAQAKQTTFPNCQLFTKGTISLVSGFTKNAYDSNLTVLSAGFLTCQADGVIVGEGQYGKGSTYNDAVRGNWKNGTVSNGVDLRIEEQYGTHPNIFVYTGTVVSDWKIVGTYRWMHNQAKGTFEWNFK